MPAPVRPAPDLTTPPRETDPTVAELFQRATQGDVQAMVDLSYRLSSGPLSSRDPLRAVDLLHHAALQGHVAAQAWVGLRLSTGVLVDIARGPDDARRAAPWLRKAAAGGNVLAARRLRDLLRTGALPSAVPREADRLDLSELAFAVEVPPVDFSLPCPLNEPIRQIQWQEAARGHTGLLLSLGRQLAPQDPQLAFLLHHEAALLAEPAAMHHTAVALWTGEDVAEDRAQAVFWLRRAVELGHVASMRFLAGRLEAGEIEPAYPNEATSLLERSGTRPPGRGG
jgi:TPR repeat protein